MRQRNGSQQQKFWCINYLKDTSMGTLEAISGHWIIHYDNFLQLIINMKEITLAYLYDIFKICLLGCGMQSK